MGRLCLQCSSNTAPAGSTRGHARLGRTHSWLGNGHGRSLWATRVLLLAHVIRFLELSPDRGPEKEQCICTRRSLRAFCHWKD